MNSAIPVPKATTSCTGMDKGAAQERFLPSGRSVLVKVTSAGEELQVRSPQGEVEVRITLGEAGPVVHLSGARLELQSPDTVALHCRRLEVNTAESIDMTSAGSLHLSGQEMRVQTTGDIDLNGDVIRLNCRRTRAAVHGVADLYGRQSALMRKDLERAVPFLVGEGHRAAGQNRPITRHG